MEATITITLISVTYICSSCNKPFESKCKPNPMNICIQCETKFYFDVILKPFSEQCISYIYTNGLEVKHQDGFIIRVNPSRTAILNNI